MYTRIFVAALFKIAKYCKEFTNRRLVKRNKLLVHVTKWMNLKNIILSEISQTQISTHHLIFIIWNCRIDNSNLWWKKKIRLVAGFPGGKDVTVTWEGYEKNFLEVRITFCIFFFFFLFFVFLGLHPQHMEVPRLGVE